MGRTLWLVCAELTVIQARIARFILFHTVNCFFLFRLVIVLNVAITVYIVKDLVPDMTLFYKQYKSIQPWLQNDNPPERGT